MGKGWRGESHRHYLAAKGIKTVNNSVSNHYYSKFSDMLAGTLKRSAVAKRKRIEMYADPYASGQTAASRDVEFAAELSKRQALQSPLTDAEAKQVAARQLAEERYAIQRSQMAGLSPLTRQIIKDPSSLDARQQAINLYVKDLDKGTNIDLRQIEEGESNISAYRERVKDMVKRKSGKELSDSEADFEARKISRYQDANRELSVLNRKIEEREIMKERALEYARTLEAIKLGEVSPAVLDRNVYLQRTWREIAGLRPVQSLRPTIVIKPRSDFI
jgi:hypothetical protein